MLKRTVTGLILVATLAGALALTYFVSPIFLDIYILIWLSIAAYEMYVCFKNSGFNIHRLPIVFLLIAAYPTFYCMEYHLGMGAQGILTVFLLAVGLELISFTFGNAEKNRIADLGANVFILIYPILFLCVAWLISFKYSAFYAVMFAVFLPLGADTLAYFTGSLLGKRKLCPSISPKKTVAGAIGGLIGSMLVAVIFYLVFDLYSLLPESGYVPFIAHSVEGWQWKSALIYLAIGLLGGVVAEIGDLAASRIKRALGIKDYGKIFPGHGGVMDRLDSIMSGLLVLLVAFTVIYRF